MWGLSELGVYDFGVRTYDREPTNYSYYYLYVGSTLGPLFPQ